jgi:hypothetical protein
VGGHKPQAKKRSRNLFQSFVSIRMNGRPQAAGLLEGNPAFPAKFAAAATILFITRGGMKP